MDMKNIDMAALVAFKRSMLKLLRKDIKNVEVVGVLSEILAIKRANFILFYKKKDKMKPITIRSILLKAKRNKQILYIGYNFLKIDIIVPDFYIGFTDEDLLNHHIQCGQEFYDYMLKHRQIIKVYENNGKTYQQIDNGFDRVKDWAKKAIYMLNGDSLHENENS